MTNMVGGKEAEVERLQAYKQMFDHAIACIDRVFQQCSENPHPILPDFCRLGADKFEAVILLAQEFVKVREENERLRAELAACRAECERLREEIDDQHPESCLIDQFCSRVCRLGTRGCINTHDEEERQ